MKSMISAILVVGYLAVLHIGWGVLGYAYYRVLQGMNSIQARNRALITCVLGLAIGIPLNKSATMPGEVTTGTVILRSIAYAWWAVPYALAIAIVVVKDKRRQNGSGPANKAL